MLGCRRKRVYREPAYSRLVADGHFAKVEVVRVPSSEYLLPVARPANRFLSPLESVQLRRGCQRREGSEASREYLERASRILTVLLTIESLLWYVPARRPPLPYTGRSAVVEHHGKQRRVPSVSF